MDGLLCLTPPSIQRNGVLRDMLLLLLSGVVSASPDMMYTAWHVGITGALWGVRYSVRVLYGP